VRPGRRRFKGMGFEKPKPEISGSENKMQEQELLFSTEILIIYNQRYLKGGTKHDGTKRST
jgi:hypothetical protein